MLRGNAASTRQDASRAAENLPAACCAPLLVWSGTTRGEGTYSNPLYGGAPSAGRYLAAVGAQRTPVARSPLLDHAPRGTCKEAEMAPTADGTAPASTAPGTVTRRRRLSRFTAGSPAPPWRGRPR